MTRSAVQSALLRVAENVAKHTIQRDGWHPGDECFLVDLTASEAELCAALDAARAAGYAAGLEAAAGVFCHGCAAGLPVRWENGFPWHDDSDGLHGCGAPAIRALAARPADYSRTTPSGP